MLKKEINHSGLSNNSLSKSKENISTNANSLAAS
jgi:hypothetical protein